VLFDFFARVENKVAFLPTQNDVDGGFAFYRVRLRVGDHAILEIYDPGIISRLDPQYAIFLSQLHQLENIGYLEILKIAS
jgi:hypothetical protein